MTTLIPIYIKRCGHPCASDSNGSQSDCAFCQVLQIAPERLTKIMYGCIDCETRRIKYILAVHENSQTELASEKHNNPTNHKHVA